MRRALAALALVATSATGVAVVRAAEPAPQATPCPAGLPAATRCLSGQDSAGALYWVALPAQWNHVLLLHAHGGPELGAPKLERSAQDLQRWQIMVKAGYAWAGSTYRQGGVAVRAAAEDTERLRGIFVDQVAKPRLTILHGQSWGAGVAAIGAEMFPGSYDGVLLSSGVLGGGSRSYDFRLDARVVYQALCRNHPKPGEPAYPLWQGLPKASTLTRAELARRIDDCTGVQQAPAQRSEAQQQTLWTLQKVLRIPERSLVGHLSWATWHFQDIVFERLSGANPFGNVGAAYSGSADDAALNRHVARYRADPAAVAKFAADADPSGRIGVPVLTVHAIDDPVAFVELESAFRETMQNGGSATRLVQTFTDEAEHSYLSDVEYPALLDALLAWVERGEKPTPEAVAERCVQRQIDFGEGCHFVPAYRPAPLATRVTPRQR